MTKKARKPSVKTQLKSALNLINQQCAANVAMEKALHEKAHEIGELRGTVQMYQGALDARDRVVVKLDHRIVQLINTVEQLSHRR